MMETKEYYFISNVYENDKNDVNECRSAKEAALDTSDFLQRAITNLGIFLDDTRLDKAERMKMYGYFRSLQAIDLALQDDADLWNPIYDPE